MTILYRKLVRSERRSYEGPVTGQDVDKVLFLAIEPRGDTLIGFRQETYEELGEPEYIEVEVRSVP